jgi:hypothetical protein
MPAPRFQIRSAAAAATITTAAVMTIGPTGGKGSAGRACGVPLIAAIRRSLAQSRHRSHTAAGVVDSDRPNTDYLLSDHQ